MKAFIAALSIVITETIKQTCRDSKIEATIMQSAENLITELKATKPDIIFLQASIIEDSKDNIITRIKEDDQLGKAFIIVNGVRIEGAEFAYQSGADAFLPIPFQKTQLEAILRNALNLPRKILLAGKEADPSTLLYRALNASGFHIILTQSGTDCISLTKKEFPDLIICDLEFPDMTGTELCRTIKSSKLLFHIPITILSAEKDATTIESCFNSGVQDILLEPFATKENIKRVAAIVTPIRGKKEKALVVDDSVLIRNLISKMFKLLGFIVITAENGDEGLKMALKEKPDIITSDYDMPILDGWGMCTELKKNTLTQDIPIIMITSRNTDTDIKKAHLIGIEGYLTKPFTIHELQSSVKKIVADNKMLKEQKVLSKYISSDTLSNVQQVIEEGKDNEPEEKFISILFSDICSFTTICENHDPKEIVTILNKYYKHMVDVLLKHNAIIDKFIGDAIVARFDSDDAAMDALNATRSALDMLTALTIFNQTSQQPLSIRIGINSGKVILGNIGYDKHRLDYTMIGDNVNTTERLEHSAEKNGCLISQPTYELVKDKITVGALQELTVKGKKDRVKAYKLISAS